MNIRHIAYCSLLVCTVAPAAEPAKEPAVEAVDLARSKAVAIFDYELGSWHCRWEGLNRHGDVVNTFEGTETFSRTLDGKALKLVTRIDGREDWSQAIKFYSPKERQIVFIDVNTSGDYYVMKQDVDTATVQAETWRANGDSMLFRFVLTRKTENEQDVRMERSFDGGKSWMHVRNQYMRRVESGTDG